jgi:hypothetical protein
MPLDDRLREALDREAATYRPDVEEHLRRVRQRSRPPGRMLRAPLAAATVLIVAVVALRVTNLDPRALGPFLGHEPPVASPSPGYGIAGSYRARVDVKASAGGSPSLAGEWVLTLGSDSAVSMIPPTTFDGEERRFEGGVYAVIGEQLVTTLFASEFSRACAGVGTYRWALDGDRLLLETVDDRCPERVVILTGAEWMRVAE